MKGRAYEVAINPKYDGYQRGLASMIHNFFLWQKNRTGSKCKWGAGLRIAQTSD